MSDGASGGGVWVAGAERGGGREGKLIAHLSGGSGSGEPGAGCGPMLSERMRPTAAGL